MITIADHFIQDLEIAQDLISARKLSTSPAQIVEGVLSMYRADGLIDNKQQLGWIQKADEIKSIRLKLGLTQEQLADKLGICAASVFRAERHTARASVKMQDYVLQSIRRLGGVKR